MPLILMQCNNCQKIFSSGIELGVGATATLMRNVSQCPYCGSMENIPDGTFKGTVEGIAKILDNSPNRLQTAKELLKSLQESKTSEDLSMVRYSSKYIKYKEWIPDSLEKIYYFIVILQVIIQLFIRDPAIKIEINNVMNVYNQVVVSQTK